MDLDTLFADSSNNSSDVDTIDSDAEVLEVEELPEAPEEGIGWMALVLFICGGLVITALVVAFMVWVIEGLVL
ncbi:hypothetical protein ACIA8G_25970 [Lentzea sp. NPDC051213]|uniref:hypothetical protein n=1 Tax=Lentzea sp. NPDC051213 TaxID=3364126 RepID=UPI00379EAF6D